MKHRAFDILIDLLKRHWPPLAIALFVLGLHSDMLFWAIPATGDHMIHLYKGWLMAEHMIPSGRLTGWSNMAFAGYPAGVYYPILGDVLVAGFRYLTLGLLTWERTYAIAFLFLLVAMPLVVYSITRKAAGQTGAFTAALLSLGDVGGWPQGGHFSTVLWAVWPFMLGLTLSLFAIPAFERALRGSFRTEPRNYLVFTILIALCVLAHPMSVFFLGLGATVFLICFAIARRKEIPPIHVVTRAALCAAVALGMTMFWVLPWIATGSDWTHGWPSVGFGGLWLPLSDMLAELSTNELFKNFFVVAWALGLAGVVIGLVSRRLWPTYLAVLLIIAFVASGLCYELGDSLISRKVQIERMAAFMKMVWFALAGVAVDRLGLGLHWSLTRLLGQWQGEDRWPGC